MIDVPLLQQLPDTRADLIVTHMAELERRGAVATTGIRTLLSSDGAGCCIIVVRLPAIFTTTTRVIVTACAEVPGSATASGARVVHRLLIIPGSGSWHMTRIIPSPQATDEDQVVTFTRLEPAALGIILAIQPLGDQLTRSFCTTTGVA